MAMIIRVMPCPVPSYEQIRAQIAEMIESGVLEPDTQLPSIRQLAADLGLAPGTIARSYKELERAGLVTQQPRRGTVVRGGTDPLPERERKRALAEAASAFALKARQLGADAAAAVEMARRAVEEGSR
jgi:DNA-binding transcriptional regulator YhcF (GntR family)